jgi:hypothetical protein
MLTEKHDEVVNGLGAAVTANIILAGGLRKPSGFHSHDWLQII